MSCNFLFIYKEWDISWIGKFGYADGYYTLTHNASYTTPCEGYLLIQSGSDAGSAAVVNVYDSNNVQLMRAFTVTPVSNGGSNQSIYIKKGAKLWVERLDNGCAVGFYKMHS